MEEKRFTVVSVNGEGVFKKDHFAASYYKKKQMDELYPAGGFSVVGQVGKGRTQIGTVSDANDADSALPVYAVSKMPHAKIVGYIPVGENEYLSIVKDVLILWILWIVLAILLLAGLAFLIKTFVPASTEPETTTRAPGVVDPYAVMGEAALTIPEKVDVSGKNISVSSVPEIHLVADQVEQTYVFSNSENNPCFFVIEMKLASTGEVLYTSNLLPPGYSITKFNLNRPLKAGTYDVILHYRPTSFDQEQRPLNNMDIKTKLVVE